MDPTDKHTSNVVSGGSNIFSRVFRFYVDGFRSMTVGRDLWLLILIKLFILFFVFKLFFFPNLLDRNYSDDEERAQAVRHTLSNPYHQPASYPSDNINNQ